MELDLKPLGPYSLFRIEGDFVFISGQIGFDGKELKDTLEAQTDQALKNIYKILVYLGLSPSDVVKATVFTTRLDQADKINTVWENFFRKFGAELPSRSFVGVSALPRSALVEIEAVAFIKSPISLYKSGKHYFVSGDFMKAHEFFERAWRISQRKREKSASIFRSFAVLSAFAIKLEEGKFSRNLLKKSFEGFPKSEANQILKLLLKTKNKNELLDYLKNFVGSYKIKESQTLED
ncbi:2-iminobutanoate/2-iminopropanoate deaminase [bacterium HR19]|nr:2-iminobutanoate/2-iminopropanoate deaminase [bacterium HR19]